MRLPIVFCLLAVLLGGLRPAAAQQVPRLSDEAQVSLLTIKPGDAVWSLWGHSAIRVYDPINAIDVSFNYGTFSFADPVSFVLQFIQGQLDYTISVQRYQSAVADYRDVEERSVVEQVLRLTPDQEQAVFAFLHANAATEGWTYRYHFLYDNCSTRLRDVFEVTLEDSIRFTEAPDPRLTFRQMINPYVAGWPVLDLGINLGLGMPVDQPVSAREATFLPDYLQLAFDAAEVRIDGAWQPLVVRTDTVVWIEQGDANRASALPWPAVFGWLLLGGGLWASVHQLRRKHVARRWPDVLLLVLAGAAGLILAYLWLGTAHDVTHPNWNLLWAWPTHLIAAFWIGRRATPGWLRIYLALGAAGALLTVIAWPFLPQALPAAAFPLALLLALRCGTLAYLGLPAPSRSRARFSAAGKNNRPVR